MTKKLHGLPDEVDAVGALFVNVGRYVCNDCLILLDTNSAQSTSKTYLLWTRHLHLQRLVERGLLHTGCVQMLAWFL